MWEFWFHWIHDEVFKEVLKALIPAIGYVFVGAITWIGIWRTSKIAKQTLEDAREATPPELLRLEKWSTILKESEQYPKNVDMDINTIYRNYKDVLKRATLENRIKDMAIRDSEIEDKLLKIKPKSGTSVYPKEKWKVRYVYTFFRIIRIVLHISLLLPSLSIFAIFLSFLYYTFSNGFDIYVTLKASMGIIFLLMFTAVLFIVYNSLRSFKLSTKFTLSEQNIIYRNCYYALRDIFIVYGLELNESSEQNKEREKFENSKWYKKWQQKNPQLTSWNYGLSISWDNNPEKDKVNDSKKDNSIEYYI